MKVGEDKYALTRLENKVYAFGEENGQNQYPFILRYYPEGTASEPREHLVWEINAPVDITRRASLTYTVELADPQSEAGLYTQLYTNEEAIIYPVDTCGSEGEGEYFERLAAAYRILPMEEERPTGDAGVLLLCCILGVCVSAVILLKVLKVRNE